MPAKQSKHRKTGWEPKLFWPLAYVAELARTTEK